MLSRHIIKAKPFSLAGISGESRKIDYVFFEYLRTAPGIIYELVFRMYESVLLASQIHSA
jgi:hypothetical protein